MTRRVQFYPSRQRLSLKGTKASLADDKTLKDVLGGETELVIKDLGPQISWRTVFLVEYVCGFVSLLVHRQLRLTRLLRAVLSSSIL